MEASMFYLTDILFSWFLGTQSAITLTDGSVFPWPCSSAWYLTVQTSGWAPPGAVLAFYPESPRSGSLSASTGISLHGTGLGIEESSHPFPLLPFPSHHPSLNLCPLRGTA